MTSATPRTGRPHHPTLLTVVTLLLLLLALGTAGVAAATDPPPTTDASAVTSVGEAATPTDAQTVKNDISNSPTATPALPPDNGTAAPTVPSTQATTPGHISEQTSSPTTGHETSTASSETSTASVTQDSKTEHPSTAVTAEAPTTFTTVPAVNHSEETTVVTSTDIEDHQPNATNGSETTSSAATTITTVAPTTLLPTTTRRRLPEVPEEDVVMKSTPTQRRLLLVLRGNCSHDSLKSDVEGAFRNLTSAAENISVTDIRCTTLLDVNVTLKAGELQLKQLLRNLSLAGTLQLGGDRHFLLTDFSVKEQVSTDGARTVRSRWVPTREELIIYVAVAVLFGIVLIIACVVCSIRCCRRQPSKTLDFLDTPRLNLRLEDYTLTRIPRPHTVYADHLRTPDQELGVVQAFDTCVVPLEDVMPPPPPAPTVPAPPCPPPRRPAEGWRTEPLMTFGGKHAKASPANGLKVARRSATRAEEEDDDESSLRGNGALSTSTERLARRDSGRRQGVDNPIYLVDRRKSKG